MIECLARGLQGGRVGGEDVLFGRGGVFSTEGPSWGYPVPGLGAVSPVLEPFCCELLSKVDKPGKDGL